MKYFYYIYECYDPLGPIKENSQLKRLQLKTLELKYLAHAFFTFNSRNKSRTKFIVTTE